MADRQLTIFDDDFGRDQAAKRGVQSGPPNGERSRLRGQKHKILERLQRGPVTNFELEQIGHRFGARLHELRQDGYDIRIVSSDAKSGERVYELRESSDGT